MEYMSHKFRVNISVEEWERPLIDHISYDQLGQVFLTHSYQVRKSIKHLIGEEILFPQARRLIFPSHLVSIFLLNSLDMLQSLSLLEIIASKVVKEIFCVIINSFFQSRSMTSGRVKNMLVASSYINYSSISLSSFQFMTIIITLSSCRISHTFRGLWTNIKELLGIR